MKTLKDIQACQIVRFLHCGGLALALIVTISQIGQAQDVTITDPTPEVIFIDNSAGATFEWEMEGFDEQFEISENGSGTGDGFFKIFPNAREDALTLRGDSVTIGGQGLSLEQLGVVGTFTGFGFSSGIELRPNPSSTTFARLRASDRDLFSIFGQVGNSSRSIFSTRIDAPANSLTISEDGDIGMGTSLQDASLHIVESDGTARVLVEEASGTTADRSLMRLTNNGPSRLEMQNTDSGRTWTMLADFNNQFQIRQNGPDTANFAIRGDGTFSFNNGGQSVMALLPTGNLRISGVLTEQSDRNSKENIEKVNASDVLAKVIDLPVSKWNYIDDESDSSHVGPMAQDFHAAFGLGDDDKSIATLDTSGVALAAIQGLNEKMQGLNDDLESENEDLQKRIERLEKMVEALSNQ